MLPDFLDLLQVSSSEGDKQRPRRNRQAQDKRLSGWGRVDETGTDSTDQITSFMQPSK